MITIKRNTWLATVCDIPLTRNGYRVDVVQCNFRGFLALLFGGLKNWFGVLALAVHLGLRHIASECLEFLGDTKIRQQEIDWVRARRRKEGFI